jgi:hypothetical protein
MALLRFEPETTKLTEYELKLVPIVVNILKSRLGRENAITNNNLVNRMSKLGFSSMTPERMRKLINHIRLYDLLDCLVASSKGYYISNDEKEISDYIGSLRGREEAIRAVRLALEAQLGRLEKRQLE